MNTAPHRLTRHDYHAMVDAGLLLRDRVELVDGEIVEMSPQKPAHAGATDLVAGALRAAFGGAFLVRCHEPLALEPDGEPEPDVAVVKGSARDYLVEHPRAAELVVEIAESSLAGDRSSKSDLYARHAIAEYWILNLVDRVLEVRRDPAAGAYLDIATLRPGARIAPLGASASSITVADLLP